jgi:hypothetical protein
MRFRFMLFVRTCAMTTRPSKAKNKLAATARIGARNVMIIVGERVVVLGQTAARFACCRERERLRVRENFSFAKQNCVRFEKPWDERTLRAEIEETDLQIRPLCRNVLVRIGDSA